MKAKLILVSLLFVSIVSFAFAETDKNVLMYFKAVEFASEGKFRQAEKEFRSITPTNDNIKEALTIITDTGKGKVSKEYALCLFKGEKFIKDGKYQEGIFQLQKAVQINPASARAYMRLGMVLYFSGKFQEAKANYQKVSQINPLGPEAYVALALACKEMGQSKEATENLQKAKELFQAQGNTAQAKLVDETLKQIP